MAFPLVPLAIAAVAAVAAVAAASKGGESSEGGEPGQGGTGLPGPEPQQAQVVQLADLARDVPIWARSGWQARAAELSVGLSNANDVAVILANEVFPLLSMPPSAMAPSANKDLWRIIRNDVWEALNPGVPYPVD